eukprot:scaffold3821_cov173-Amphora_coffeaeformis.AAC.9
MHRSTVGGSLLRSHLVLGNKRSSLPARWSSTCNFVLVGTWLSLLRLRSIFALQLTTTARSRLPAVELHDFLARPIHWPQIVASSDSVSSDDQDPSLPLRPGKSVDEFFGVGLLSVKWTCKQSKTGSLLVVESAHGIPGIAKDCSMRFDVQDDEVTLTMGYEPVSPLAILATPVLIVDNGIALNLLLPVWTRLPSLHSVLFTTNGIPAFVDLPVEGQVYAALWCAVGLLSWWLSRQTSSLLNDSGLIVYGLVESVGALWSGNGDAFGSVLMVQAIVAAAWIYSFQKEKARST